MNSIQASNLFASILNVYSANEMHFLLIAHAAFVPLVPKAVILLAGFRFHVGQWFRCKCLKEIRQCKQVKVALQMFAHHSWKFACKYQTNDSIQFVNCKGNGNGPHEQFGFTKLQVTPSISIHNQTAPRHSKCYHHHKVKVASVYIQYNDEDSL